ncbi:MAG: alpha/beta fold hydrolase [Candidatus Binatus sp.]
MAPLGGICISERVYEDIRNKPELPAKFLGEKTLKNVTRPINVYAIAPPGGAVQLDPETIAARRRKIRRRLAVALVMTFLVIFGYAVSHTEIETLARIYVPRLLPPEVKQKIAYTTTRDGVRIAYGTSGKGPPVVIAVGLLTHLKLGLLSPTYNSAFLKPLVARHSVIEYDGRGFGMSDRGLKDYSVEARLRDLDAVVDESKLDRFALFGISSGCEVAIAYVAQHPDRVTRLVLYAGDVDSRPNPDLTPERRKIVEAARTLVENGWSDAAVRELFAAFEIPTANEVQKRFFAELVGESATPEDLAAFAKSNRHVDVKPFAAQVRVPTLIIQVRGDQISPIADGKRVAEAIPSARFVIIEGVDHIPMPGDGESEEIAQLVVPFLDEDLPAKATPSPVSP